MASSTHESDPKKLPIPQRPRADLDIVHHQREWSSGQRGGGSVPKDFGWPSNPKQHQEERGSGEL